MGRDGYGKGWVSGIIMNSDRMDHSLIPKLPSSSLDSGSTAAQVTQVGLASNGGTPKWLVYFLENRNREWMIWGYPHDLGNLQIGSNGVLTCLDTKAMILQDFPS